MAIGLDPKQVVSFEELLISQAVSQDALIRLLIEKGIFTQEEFLEMVKKVDQREREAMSINKTVSCGIFHIRFQFKEVYKWLSETNSKGWKTY